MAASYQNWENIRDLVGDTSLRVKLSNGDGDDELRELGGLEAKGTYADPALRTTGLVSNEQYHQQCEAYKEKRGIGIGVHNPNRYKPCRYDDAQQAYGKDLKLIGKIVVVG